MNHPEFSPEGDELRREIDITPAKKEEPKQVPPVSTEKFNENKEAWQKIVASGRKTAPELIVFLESKAPLTDEQKKEIGTWQKAVEKPVVAATSDVVDVDFVAGLDASGGYCPE